MKTLEINGIIFVVVNPKTRKAQRYIAATTKPLHRCYSKPSISKQAVYDYWERVCNKMGGQCYGVASYNTFNFSVSWYTDQHVFYITPSYNYVV